MYSLKSFWQLVAGNCQTAVNDNAASRPEDDAAPRSDRDPYLSQAHEARRLASSARLIGAADGNPAAVLNVLATRHRPAA